MRPASIRVQRRIEWPDTDGSGNFHNTAAFRMIEAAEMALLERLGFVHEVAGKLPRVQIETTFRRPLRLRDLVEISLRIDRVGRTSVTYQFEMTSDGRVAVVGRVVAVLLDRHLGSPVPWPEEQRRLLETAGAQRPELLVTG